MAMKLPAMKLQHLIGLRRSAEDMHSICRLTHDTINEQEDME